MSNRKDRERRERRARERKARGQAGEAPKAGEEQAAPVPPPANGSVQDKPVVDKGPNWPYVPAQFKKGESGNPTGYSARRRFTDGILGLITERKADRAIATIWLKEVLDGNRHYFKMLLERSEGAIHFRDTDVVLPDLDDGMSIDAEVAQRILLAAAPDLVPDLDDEP